MPTKDGISGTGVDGNRSHTRRMWGHGAPGARTSDLTRILGMLTDDHAHVDRLFKRVESLAKRRDGARYEVVAQACEALTVHLRLEEELFYPAVRDAVPDEEDDVDEGEVEHAHIRELVDDLKTLNEDDPLCDAKVKVLMDYVRHHVKEEEEELFPALRKAKPGFTGLYEKMVKRREELEQHGMAAAELAIALAKENFHAPH
jgi:hemerythrin superfamily protein